MTSRIPGVGRIVQALFGSSDDVCEPTSFAVDVEDFRIGWVRAATDLDKTTAEKLAETIYTYENEYMGMGVSSDNVRVVPTTDESKAGLEWYRAGHIIKCAISTSRTSVLRG